MLNKTQDTGWCGPTWMLNNGISGHILSAQEGFNVDARALE